jgi:hypothetical protein
MIDWGDDEEWDLQKLHESTLSEPKKEKIDKEAKKKEKKEMLEKKIKEEAEKKEKKKEKEREKEREKEKKKEEKEKKKEKKEKKEGKEEKDKTRKNKKESTAKTRKEPGLKKQEKEEEPVKLKSQEEKTEVRYWEIVNNYFFLKNKYEKELEKLKDGLRRDESLKENMRRLVAPCVNCRRNVGSIFKTTPSKINDTAGRVFSVKCGDVVTPCALNISFMIPNITNFNSVFEKDDRYIEMLKRDIIICKNDLIFNYADEEYIMNRFGSIKDKLNTLLNDNSYSLDVYSSLTKKSDIDEMKKTQEDYINDYNKIINDYNKTKSPALIQDAMRLYISEIRPLGKKILESSYSQNMVENDDGVYHLIQREVPISLLETIGRFPMIYENLDEYIISNHEEPVEKRAKENVSKDVEVGDVEVDEVDEVGDVGDSGYEKDVLKKLNKKIMIIPATEAH